MKHTLEGSRLFPYIAWILVIIFAGTVYFFAKSAQQEMTRLDTKTNTLETNLKIDLEKESMEGF